MTARAFSLFGILTALAALAGGCAREVYRVGPPLSPYAPPGRPTWAPQSYAWQGAGEGAPSSQSPPDAYAEQRAPFESPPAVAPGYEPVPRAPREARRRLPIISSANIPNGSECLELLESLSVPHRLLDEKRGVTTPLTVTGTIGGVRYRPGAGLPFHCDCRLAVALAWAAPVLRELGVTDVQYSGVYVYRNSRVGRLSLHAYGLAIDMHKFTIGGRQLSVEDDYERGHDEPCSSRAPVLNQLGCRLKQLGLFKEVLTPDYDRDHHDHFHLGIAPLEALPGNAVARAGF